MQQAQKPPPGTISNDAGSLVDFNPGNPFAKLVDKNAEQGTLRNFLGRIFDNGQLTPGTGTVGGGGLPDHVPGTEQDAALNPTPMKDQKQKRFAPVDEPPPPVGPNGAPTDELDANALKAYADKTYDYSQPTALDPVAIEQLRKSLLTQAGQMDPNNPNGLSGRMNSPNAAAEQTQQIEETQRMGDQLRSGANSLQNDRRNGKRSSLDPYRVAGDYLGGVYDSPATNKEWNDTWEEVPKEKLKPGEDPNAYMKRRPDDEEGRNVNDLMFIRKKRTPSLTS